MLTPVEKDAAAKARVSAFVDRSLVLLTETPHGIRSEHPASGVLLRLRSGRVAVLTAAHALPDTAPLNVYRTGRVYEDAVDAVGRHPDEDVDVGLALLRPAAAQQLHRHALGVDQIESSPIRRIERGVPLVAAGFPSQFTEDAAREDGGVQHRFSALMKYTNIHNHDSRHLSFDWSEGYPIVRDQPPAHPALEVPAGTPVRLKKPNGLSGGPVYRVTVGTFETFDPEKNCTLVAVATEFVNQRELAAPWWRWSDWVRTL